MSKRKIQNLRLSQHGKTVFSLFLSLVILLNSIFFVVQPMVDAAPPPPEGNNVEQEDDSGQDTASHSPPIPDELSAEEEHKRAKAAMEAVLGKYLDYLGSRYHATLENVKVEGEWGYGAVNWSGEARITDDSLQILAHNSQHTGWQALLPSIEGQYLQWLDEIPVQLVSLTNKELANEQAIRLTNLRQPASNLTDEVKAAVFQYLGETSALKIEISTVARVDNWVFGLAALPAATEEHAGPDSFLYIAQSEHSTWNVAIEHTPLFQQWLDIIPETLISLETRPFLKDGLIIEGNGAAQLSLPWATASTWRLTGGPHSNDGSGHPWSAIDFNIAPGQSGEIRAARNGYAYLPCANFIRIDHDDGWQSGYYHVSGITVSNGQYVPRGTLLGYTSSATGCGGSATGPHVHFSLRRNGVHQALDGHDIGGWTVQEGASEYTGCMTKNGNTQCPSGGQIYNDGTIGSGGSSSCSAPSLISPANGAVLSNNTVNFSWNAVSGCTFSGYTFRVCTSANIDDLGSCFIDTGEGGTNRTETITGHNNQDLYWGVKAANAPGGSNWAVRQFRINDDPPPPPSGQVRFYDNINYGDPYVYVNTPGLYTLEPNFNDLTESIQMPSGWSVRLFKHNDYFGPEVCIQGNDSSLWNNNYSDGTTAANSATWAEVYDQSSCPPIIVAPSAPSLQSPSNGASFNEGQNVTLVWNSASNATQYYAEYWGGPAGTIFSGWQSGTSWYIGSQWPGYTYYWRVKAKNSAGESGWSSTRSFIVRPAAPSNLSAQTASCSQINLYWTDNSGSEDGFKIYRGGSLVAQVGAGITSYQNNGLNENTSYVYTVKAFRGSIESNASNTASVTTPTCAPPQPDLVPAQWGGWQYPIVPSSITETNTVNNLYANNTTYIDWGLANDGNANSGGDSYGDFYIDDILIAHYNFGNVLAGQSWAFLDWQETIAEPGWHTLKVVVDPDNLIAESDETNNTWERQFYWIGSTPYFDDMENGINDWNPSSSLWHQVGSGSPYPNSYSPTHSWWYGQDSSGNYNTGSANSGALTVPPIYIPAAGNYLRFRYWYETETQWIQYDQRWLQISVDGGPFNNVLQLYDDPMNRWLEGPIVDLSPYAGQTIQLRFYFNSVDSIDNNFRGWYIDNVSITSTPPPTCSDVHEPNNEPTEAAIISYGQILSGDMCPNGDYDYFRFTGNAGDKIVIDIDAMSIGSLLDPYVYLIDSDGTTVLAEHDDEILGQVRDSKLAYHLTHDGTYYIKLKAWDHPSAGSPNHFYLIKLFTDDNSPTASFTSPLNDAWIDPVNETLQATTSDAESGVNRVEFLWHDDDWSVTDWVWLGADNDGRDGWSFNFDSSGLPEQRGGAFYLWAFDWSGNWVGAAAWNMGIDRTPPTVAAEVYPLYGDAPFIDFWVRWWNSSDNLSGIADYDVQFREGAGGIWTDLEVATTNVYTRFVGIDGNTYYFRARSRDNAGNQSIYSSSDDQYTVQTCPVSADMFEADNNYLASTLIAPNGITQTHNIHQEGDQDWVTFYASDSVTYTIKTDNSGGHADTILYLYDTDGTSLLTSNDDDPNNWPSSRIEWRPNTGGNYYIKVDHWDPWAYGCTTTYGLSITTDDITSPTGSIIINNGDPYATSTNVVLSLNAVDGGTGVDQMMLSNDSSFPGAQWQDFDSSVNWVIPSGNGPKTIYVKYRDWAGNVSTTYSDDIILDVSAPQSSASSPAYSNASPIAVSWSTVDTVVEQGEEVLVLANTELWVKVGTGSWTATGLVQTGSSGVFDYSAAGDDVYCFGTVATDSAGNQETIPTGNGDSCTTYDATPPQSTATSPNYTNAPFNVTWTATDNLAGIDEVELWVRPLGSAWSATGQVQTGISGTFTFTPSAGDGRYCFATVATDNAANQEASPTGNGDTCAVYDSTPPVGNILIDNDAAYATSTSVTLTLSSTDDGVGVDQMMLSNQPGFPGASWQSYSNSVSWNLLPGNGLKTVYVKYRDLVGNVSAVYSDNITLDATLPQSIATSPAYTTASPIPVQWTASDTFTDEGFVALDTVELWVKIGTGSWISSGLIQSGNSGTFNYPASGEELYCFATVATDVAGNQEPLPSGSGDSCTTFDFTAPSSTASSPQYANTTFDVDWTADDNLAGVASVALWYRVGIGSWASTAMTQTGTSGTFQFSPTNGDEDYCFATVATDLAGNQQAFPTGSGDSCTIFDTTPPASTASAPQQANSGQVQVSWTANNDASGIASVTLWVRFEGGAWQDTGLSAQSGTSGVFNYIFGFGPGTYEFATRAVDNAGNDEGVPSAADTTTEYTTNTIFTPILLRN